MTYLIYGIDPEGNKKLISNQPFATEAKRQYDLNFNRYAKIEIMDCDKIISPEVLTLQSDIEHHY
jgi:hypothetical protein